MIKNKDEITLLHKEIKQLFHVPFSYYKLTKLKKYIKLFLLYIKKNKLTALFWAYIFGSILLQAISEIDVTISCPINQFLGIRCYGCGLTTATIFMLKLDFVSAWQANPFTFLIDPMLVFFFVRHWRHFINEETFKNT